MMKNSACNIILNKQVTAKRRGRCCIASAAALYARRLPHLLSIAAIDASEGATMHPQPPLFRA